MDLLTKFWLRVAEHTPAFDQNKSTPDALSFTRLGLHTP